MILNHHHIKSPTRVLSTYLDTPLDYRQQCIKEIYSLDNTNEAPTNVRAVRSSYHIWDESEVFNNLLKNITNIVGSYFPKYDPRIKGCELIEAWSVIYKKGHFSVSHNHIPQQISFVYYLQSIEKTPLIFDNSDFQIIPKNNMLIMFPSYLNHSVPKHKGKTDRICLAGNLIWEY
jgi:hypothetical protein